MILGIGIDIIRIERLRGVLDRHGALFCRRIFTEREQACALVRARQMASFYAGRWAAKEAVAKALGCGFGPNCAWLEIEVLNNDLGGPQLCLTGRTLKSAAQRGIAAWQLSISHEQDYAVAMALAQGSGEA